MSESLLAFAVFAAVLTVTPGLDTLLVLRTAAVAGRRPALAAGLGIGLGCVCWAVASALGITAVLGASRVAFDVLRLAGAAYLCWLGVRLLWRRRGLDASDVSEASTVDIAPAAATPGAAFRTGLTTNLLNPKVGVFYLSVLPQFLPDGVAPLIASTALAAVHVVEGLLWFTVIVLAVHRAAHVLARPAVKRWLDRLTGLVFVALGARLAGESFRRA